MTFPPILGITLHEPWATLMMIAGDDGKSNETRSWDTDYRGPLAIHAGLTLDTAICRTEPYLSVLHRHFGTWAFLDRFKLGHIIGTRELIDIFKTERAGEAFILTPNERAFGNYDPQRFAWITDYPMPLPRPIKCRGKQRLWYLTDDQIAEINQQTPSAGLTR